jgi:hypothetical protein
MVLPTYVNTFRQQSWGKDQHEDAAKSQALQKVRDELSGDNLKKTNWIFLTTRISEIEMFVKYRKGVEKHGFYRWQIVKQSLLSVIPRFLWSDKPVTENLAMERAFDNNIVDRIARVSAKPAFLVDGYLSGGSFGVWLALFLYGAIAQLVCNKAEELFGGYLLGTVLVFTALFRPMWRGDCFEFVFNYVFWSYVSMYIVFYFFKKAGILSRVVPGPTSAVPDEVTPEYHFSP